MLVQKRCPTPKTNDKYQLCTRVPVQLVKMIFPFPQTSSFHTLGDLSTSEPLLSGTNLYDLYPLDNATLNRIHYILQERSYLNLVD